MSTFWPSVRNRHGHRRSAAPVQTAPGRVRASSLPLAIQVPVPPRMQLPPAFDPPADPSKPVQCVRCNAIDLVSNMRYDGRDWRCRGTDACTDRWYAHGTYDPKPVSLLPAGAALASLPAVAADFPSDEAIAKAVATLNAAHDEQDAAEKRGEPEDTPDGGAGLVPDETAPSGPASLAPSTAEPDGGDAE